MATDIWHDPTKKLPDKDSAIERIDFDKDDLIARPSHMPKNLRKPGDIVHVNRGK